MVHAFHTEGNTRVGIGAKMIVLTGMTVGKLLLDRGGRGKLFIGASCATPNCSLVNICTANVIAPLEKSVPEISIYHVCLPVKVM